MKKLVSLLLALLIMALPAACSAPPTEPQTPAAAVEETAAAEEPEVPAVKEEEKTINGKEEEEKTSPDEPPPQEEPQPLRIVFATDLHYLSQSLTDNGPLFQAVTEAGDGKRMLEIEAIAEAFTEQVIAERPDLVILSGDISYNGERESHLDLAKKLERMRSEGIMVLVMPGNHDLNSRRAFRFEGESYARTESVDAEEFMEIYRNFGYADALSLDELSNSYICAPCEDLRILMLDTNSRITNALPSDSLSWLEEQLLRAGEDNAAVITVSHQNVLLHNALFSSGYQITNGPQITSVYRRCGVLANLSGHMHIQHYLTGDVPELLSTALSLPPFRFGLLLWDGERLSYEARSVDVSRWAQEHDAAGVIPPDYDEAAAAGFYEHFYRQAEASLSELDLPEEDVDRLARCFAGANSAYFSGERIDLETLREDLDYWAKIAGESFYTVYLRSILLDEAPDPLKILFGPQETG